jgi:NitT/TauT family transport system substrate-binding protein
MKNRLTVQALIAASIFALCATSLQAETPGGAAARRELRVGVFLDSDSLPLLVADAEGRFAAEGISVKLVAFQNPVERDAALQSGAVDGVVSDLLAGALATQSGFEVRVTSLTDGRYGIAAAPGSGIASARALAGQSIGISTNSIIQYAAESLLAEAGVPSSDIKEVAVPKMPVRLELLLSGQLKAACLPEPLLTAAAGRGATIVAKSDDLGLKAGVLLFTKKALDERLTDIKAFYRAYAAAASAINANNDKYRPFLVEKVAFPASVRDAYLFVNYKKPRLPGLADVEKVLSWMKTKGILKADVAAASLLDGRAIAGMAVAGD